MQMSIDRFSDGASQSQLNLLEQFAALDHVVQASDRNVQIALLRTTYSKIVSAVTKTMQSYLQPLKHLHGHLSVSMTRISKLSEHGRPNIENADLLTDGILHTFTVSREHHERRAVAHLVGYGVGMNIHVYSASYTHPHNAHAPLSWSTIAIIDESQLDTPEAKTTIIFNALAEKLAHEVREMGLRNLPK